MKKRLLIKLSTLILLLSVVHGYGYAQNSYDHGFREFYNKNYKQALAVFQSVVSADPNQELANYYLGQTYIKLHQIDQAEKAYDDALKNPKFSKSALLFIGKAHVTLLKGDSLNARVAFDEALGMSKHKTSDILNAVGYANLEKKGNLDYGIDVLNQLSDIKKITNSKPYVTLGHLYKKKHDGSKSVQAFNTATRMNPQEAEAYYQVGKIFATQNNEEVFLANYRNAVQADPEFHPAYFELYSYYFNKKNVDSARKYLTLYESTAKDDDQKQLTTLFAAELLFLEKKYEESLQKAYTIQPSDSKGDTYLKLRILRLEALCLNAQSKINEAFDIYKTYIEQMDATDHDPDFTDLFLYEKMLTKADDSRRKTYFYPMAVRIFSTKPDDSKLNSYLLGQLVDMCKQENYLEGVAQVKLAKLAVGTPTNREYFDAGYAFYGAGVFTAADSLLRIYISKQPTDPYGHFWAGITNLKLDSTLQKSVPFFESYIDLTKDKVKDYKTGIVQAYQIIAGSQSQSGKYEDAIVTLSKLLTIDPTNAVALKTKGQLEQYKKKVEEYNRQMEIRKKMEKELKE